MKFKIKVQIRTVHIKKYSKERTFGKNWCSETNKMTVQKGPNMVIHSIFKRAEVNQRWENNMRSEVLSK